MCERLITRSRIFERINFINLFFLIRTGLCVLGVNFLPLALMGNFLDWAQIDEWKYDQSKFSKNLDIGRSR